MAHRVLRDVDEVPRRPFDIHTGGNDLKFPHHEDEIAQSEGAVGHQVVSIWVHGGFLQLSGQKMAKSARNIYA